MSCGLKRRVVVRIARAAIGAHAIGRALDVSAYGRDFAEIATEEHIQRNLDRRRTSEQRSGSRFTALMRKAIPNVPPNCTHFRK